MAQEPKRIDIMVALNIVDQVLSQYVKKGEDLNWDKNPGLVIMELMSAADMDDDYYAIEYNKAVSILEQARSTKLTPSSNRGMDEIKRQWKENYI